MDTWVWRICICVCVWQWSGNDSEQCPCTSWCKWMDAWMHAVLHWWWHVQSYNERITTMTITMVWYWWEGLTTPLYHTYMVWYGMICIMNVCHSEHTGTMCHVPLHEYEVSWGRRLRWNEWMHAWKSSHIAGWAEDDDDDHDLWCGVIAENRWKRVTIGDNWPTHIHSYKDEFLSYC